MAVIQKTEIPDIPYPSVCGIIHCGKAFDGKFSGLIFKQDIELTPVSFRKNRNIIFTWFKILS